MRKYFHEKIAELEGVIKKMESSDEEVLAAIRTLQNLATYESTNGGEERKHFYTGLSKGIQLQPSRYTSIMEEVRKGTTPKEKTNADKLGVKSSILSYATDFKNEIRDNFEKRLKQGEEKSVQAEDIIALSQLSGDQFIQTVGSMLKAGDKNIHGFSLKTETLEKELQETKSTIGSLQNQLASERDSKKRAQQIAYRLLNWREKPFWLLLGILTLAFVLLFYILKLQKDDLKVAELQTKSNEFQAHIRTLTAEKDSLTSLIKNMKTGRAEQGSTPGTKKKPTGGSAPAIEIPKGNTVIGPHMQDETNKRPFSIKITPKIKLEDFDSPRGFPVNQLTESLTGIFFEDLSNSYEAQLNDRCDCDGNKRTITLTLKYTEMNEKEVRVKLLIEDNIAGRITTDGTLGLVKDQVRAVLPNYIRTQAEEYLKSLLKKYDLPKK